jgi:hypothetical protein
MVVACSSDRVPESVMTEEQMINYLVELHIAESAVQNLRLKSDSAVVVFSVVEKRLLKEHNITDSTFVKSYNFYLQNPDKLESIYSAVVDTISLRQSLIIDSE